MDSAEPEAWQERLEHVLHHHGVALSAQEFVEILSEAADASEPLTEGEQAFLVEHASVAGQQFASDAYEHVHLRVAQAKAVADQETRARSLTTSEVAQLFGQATSNVRRTLAEGRLYSVGSTRARERLFPDWQFTPDGRVLPGLRDVLAAFPVDFHPLDIESFMLTPNDALGQRSPISWLAGGGDVHTVAELAEQLAYT